MTDPAIQHAMDTGLAPGEKAEEVERYFPLTKSCDMEKSNRHYEIVKKLESMNNGD